MFGLGHKRQTRTIRPAPRRSSTMRTALLAGAGMLAWKWWQNRNESRQPTGTLGTAGNGGGWGRNEETRTGARSGFAAGGTTPGGSAF